MPNLTERAEKALLGAMLLNGGRSAATLPVKQADFADHTHRALFLMIQEASFSPADRRYLNEIKKACPDPDHAGSYAQMVIESGLRRHVLAHALRLEYAAGDLHHHAQRLAGIAAPGGTAEDLLKRALRTGTDRVELPVERLLSHELLVSLALRAHIKAFDPARDSAQPAPAGAPEEMNGLRVMIPASSAGVSWHAAMPSAPEPRDLRTEREERVLASIICQHRQSSALIQWLSAEAFTDPARREVFTAITRLHARGEPVDELTVDWERARYQAAVPGVPGPDTSYGARLARLHTDPAVVLRTARQLSPAPRELAAQQHIRPATAAPLPLSPPPPRLPGDPGHSPRM